MLVNNILNIKFSSLNLCFNNKVSFGSNFPDKIITSLNDKEKIIFKRFNLKDNVLMADYIGITDNNDCLIRDMRYDRRYNEIRAIEYKKPYGGFNYIQNSLTVSFDNNGKIRSVYLINKDGNNITHNVLNEKHGHGISIYNEDGLRTEPADKQKEDELNFLIKYTTDTLQEAQENNLTGSEGILDKFSEFLKSVI